ncbi:hypothetical protein BGI32_09575, partial [Snodgrassella alvi]
SENSTDAVNAGQLFSLSSSTSTSVESLSTTLRNAGDLSNVNTNINSLSSSLNTANSSISSLNNNVSNLQKDALQWNGSAYDASHGTTTAQKITNVAAGSISENSTDAVNAGQLFSLSSSTSTSVESLSTTLRNAGDLSNVNTNINSLSSSLNTANSSISSLNNNVSNLQKDALQWNGSAYDASHGTTTAQKITNVAAGSISENSTDAVNAGQLFSLSSSTSTSVESLSTTLRNAGDLSNVNTNINSLSSSLNTANSSISSLNNNVSNLQKDALQWNGSAYDASHGTTTAQKITNVAAGSISENSTDAVNAGQLFSLSSSTSTSVESLSTTLRNAGDLSNVNTNINSLSSSLNTANSSISSLNNNVSNLQKDALQWNGSAYDASHGTTTAQKITNVAAGSISENSTDAVNAGQLFSLSSSTSTSVESLSTTLRNAGDLSNVNTNINSLSSSLNTANSSISSLNNNVSNLQKDALQWNGSAYDASHGTTTAQKITNVAAGSISENSTDAVNAGQLFSLSSSTSTSVESLSTTLRNAGDLSNVNTNINSLSSSLNTANSSISSLNNNVSNLQKDALQWNGSAYDASHGSANAQKITHVAAGNVTENSTDAINGGQLYSLSNSTMTGLDNLSTAFSVSLSTGLSTANLRIDTVSQSTATLAGNLSTAVNSISTLQKDALQWNGTAYDAGHGTANAQKIVKVAAGDVSENSTDAVNAGQLFSLSSSTSTSVESLSTTLRNAGDLSNVNNNINSLTNNVSNLQKDALQWNGTAYDASHGTANAQKIIKVAAGDVSENSTDAVNGGQLYSLFSSAMTGLDNLSTAFSDSLSTGLSTANLRIDTVSQSTATLASNLSTAVNSISTLQKDALQWNGTAYDASHGTANAQKITKVAAGDITANSTDAVNAGQLFSLSSSTSTSVESLSTTLRNAGDLSNVNNNINSLNNNVSNLQKDALQWNGTAYDASHGTANAQKITKVAAGDITANSTDAVNAGQLFSLSSSTSTSVESLSTTLRNAGDLSNVNNNINSLNNNVSNLQKDALQWNGTAYDASHGTANAQKITKVAAGDITANSTDAVNAGQLFSLSSSTSTSVESLSTTLRNAGDLSNVNNNINSLNNNVSNLQKDALQWNGTAYDASHGTANAQKITKVAAGDITANSTDAVNAGQLFSLSSSTSTSVESLSTTLRNAGDLSNVNNNINSLNNNVSNLQKDALQWNGTAYDASHGTANAQKITKVAAGDITANSTDAVNAGQLFSLSSSTSTSVESLSTTLRNAGDLSNVNNNINSLNNNVSNLQKDALQWNGTAYDASHGTANAQKIIKVAAGDISANSTDAVNGGQLYSLSSSTVTGLANLSTAFSDSLSTGLNTANSRIDTVSQSTATLAGNLSTAVNSISTLQKDALQWNGTAYDASHGTANAQRIINVANGNIGENSTDAINGGQLYSISSSIFSSVSSSVENVVNENKINMDAVNRDLKTAQSALQTAQNDIQTAQTDIQTSKKLIEELQKNAVHFDDNDAGSSSFFGLNRDASNERTISNIANGRVDATSNQAVNGRQLYALSTSTSTSLSSLQDQLNLASGNIPAGLSSSLSTLMTDALQWNGTAYDASHHSGSPQKITNLAVGDIGEHSTDAVNGSQLWQMKNDFKQDLQNLSTSTANALSKVAESLGGNASFDDPVTRAGTGGTFTPPNYISSTADGTEVIVHNVGDALSNLYNGGSKYAKVNSTLSAASASGNNAIAIGGAATASGNAAVAIGAEAKASVADGVAIGNHASVTQSGGVALGANSVANTAGGIMGY